MNKQLKILIILLLGNFLFVSPSPANRTKIYSFTKEAQKRGVELTKKNVSSTPKTPNLKAGKDKKVNGAWESAPKRPPKRLTRKERIEKGRERWGVTKDGALYKKTTIYKGKKRFDGYFKALEREKRLNTTKAKLKRERINRKLKQKGKNLESVTITSNALRNIKVKDIDNLVNELAKKIK